MRQEGFGKRCLEIANGLSTDGVLDKKVLRRHAEPVRLIEIGNEARVSRALYGGGELPAGILEFRHCPVGKDDVQYLHSTLIQRPEPFLERIRLNFHPSLDTLDGEIIADADAFIIEAVNPEKVLRICNELKRSENPHQMPRCVWLVSSSGANAEAEIYKKVGTHLGCRFEVCSNVNVSNISRFKASIVSRLDFGKVELLRRELLSCLNREIQRIPTDIKLRQCHEILQEIDRFLSDLPSKLESISNRLATQRASTEEQVENALAILVSTTREQFRAIVKKPFLRKERRSARWHTTRDRFNAELTTLLEDHCSNYEKRGKVIVEEGVKEIAEAYEALIKAIAVIADFSLEHESKAYAGESILKRNPPSRKAFRTSFTVNTGAAILGKGFFGYMAVDAAQARGTEVALTALLSNTLNISGGTTVAFAGGGTALGSIGGFTTVAFSSGGLGAGSSILATMMGTAGTTVSAGAKAGSLPAPGAGTLIGAGVGLVIGIGVGGAQFYKHVKEATSEIDKAFDAATSESKKAWKQASIEAMENLKKALHKAMNKGCGSPRTQLLKITEALKAELRQAGFSPSGAALTVDELAERLRKYRKYSEDLA